MLSKLTISLGALIALSCGQKGSEKNCGSEHCSARPKTVEESNFNLNGTVTIEGKSYLYRILNAEQIELSPSGPEASRSAVVSINSLQEGQFVLDSGDGKDIDYKQWRHTVAQDLAWAEEAHPGEALSDVKITKRYAGFPVRRQDFERSYEGMGDVAAAFDKSDRPAMEAALGRLPNKGAGVLVNAWSPGEYKPAAAGRAHIDGAAILGQESKVLNPRGEPTRIYPYFPRTSTDDNFHFEPLADKVESRGVRAQLVPPGIHEFQPDALHRGPTMAEVDSTGNGGRVLVRITPVGTLPGRTDLMTIFSESGPRVLWTPRPTSPRRR